MDWGAAEVSQKRTKNDGKMEKWQDSVRQLVFYRIPTVSSLSTNFRTGWLHHYSKLVLILESTHQESKMKRTLWDCHETERGRTVPIPLERLVFFFILHASSAAFIVVLAYTKVWNLGATSNRFRSTAIGRTRWTELYEREGNELPWNWTRKNCSYVTSYLGLEYESKG